MSRVPRSLGYAWVAAAAVLLAACANQMEPAQRSISDIEAILTATSAEASKYIPDQYADTQARLSELKSAFDRRDYAAVLKGAPAAMTAAQGLASAAAAKKDEVIKALNGEWTGLAATLPATMTAIQGHVDQLGKKYGKKPPAGINLDAARSGLADASAAWSRAQAAFAAGNLEEALKTANGLKANLEALAGTLKINLAAPAAAH